MERTYEPHECYTGLLLFLPNIVATSLVWWHIARNKFDAKVSMFFQIALALNMIAVASDMLYMHFRLRGIRHQSIYFVHMYANLFQLTAYMFGQTQFFYALVQANETKSQHFIFFVRLLVLISTSMCAACYLHRLIVNDVSDFWIYLDIVSYYATNVADVVGLAYLIVYSIQMIKVKNLNPHFQLTFAFLVSFAVYIVGFALTFIHPQGNIYFMIFRDSLQLIYVPVSYTCIMIIFRMLKKFYQENPHYRLDQYRARGIGSNSDVEHELMQTTLSNSTNAPSESSTGIPLENLSTNNSSYNQINTPSNNISSDIPSNIQINVPNDSNTTNASSSSQAGFRNKNPIILPPPNFNQFTAGISSMFFNRKLIKKTDIVSAPVAIATENNSAGSEDLTSEDSYTGHTNDYEGMPMPSPRVSHTSFTTQDWIDFDNPPPAINSLSGASSPSNPPSPRSLASDTSLPNYLDSPVNNPTLFQSFRSYIGGSNQQQNLRSQASSSATQQPSQSSSRPSIDVIMNTSDDDDSFHSHCDSHPPSRTSYDDTPQCSSSAVMTDRMRAESMGAQSAARQRIVAMKPNPDDM